MKALAIALLLYSSALGQKPVSQPPPRCIVMFTVATEDRLKNINMGLSAKEVDWVNKLQKKYPGVCYTGPDNNPHAILFIVITPATYNGTRTISSEDSSYEKPYSVEYGIFTLMVERPHPDGSLTTIQTFQQNGLYSEIYGIPLEKRGHHPAHAVIEDAIKWLSAGGLNNPNQGSVLVPNQP